MLQRSVWMLAIPSVLLCPTAHADEPCKVAEVEYALAGNLRLSNTPMGKGDGTYRIGPGRAVIRFEGDRATLVSYRMDQQMTIRPSAVFWSATLVTTSSAMMPESVRVEGAYDGHAIRWASGVPGYRIDGTCDCSGSLCGRFGAPPAGRSELHVGPYTQWFEPFVFSPDGQTFTMDATPGPRTQSPKQSSMVSVAGREIKRTCVTPGS
jgi:hypothetical protein